MLCLRKSQATAAPNSVHYFSSARDLREEKQKGSPSEDRKWLRHRGSKFSALFVLRKRRHGGEKVAIVRIESG